MTACAGIPARCFFAFLVFAGGAALGVDTEKSEPRSDAEGSASHVALYAVPAPSRSHIRAGEAQGTKLSDAGSQVPAHPTLPHEVLMCLREACPPVRHSVERFLDRVSYRTTGPPFQTS